MANLAHGLAFKHFNTLMCSHFTTRITSLDYSTFSRDVICLLRCQIVALYNTNNSTSIAVKLFWSHGEGKKNHGDHKFFLAQTTDGENVFISQTQIYTGREQQGIKPLVSSCKKWLWTHNFDLTPYNTNTDQHHFRPNLLETFLIAKRYSLQVCLRKTYR